MAQVTAEESLEQSKRAYNTWGPQWRYNTEINREFMNVHMKELMYQGTGKVAVCVSGGASLDDQLETIKSHRDKIDVLCIDKTFGTLIDNGIIPDYMFTADANVSFELYCEPWLKYTKDIIMVSNICGNPNWGANWKGPKTYYVNKDNIESEKEFCKLSGIPDTIPAGSNVSNSMIVYTSSVIKYDEYILCGFDFSFKIGGNFYSSDNYHVKNFYLNQMRVINPHGRLVSTSHNLSFSCRWLYEWITRQIGAKKVINTNDEGILGIPRVENLEDALGNILNYRRALNEQELRAVKSKKFEVTDIKSFEAAKELLCSEDVVIYGCSIDYRSKGDSNYAREQKSRTTVDHKN
jgi:hypothetical protein